MLDFRDWQGMPVVDRDGKRIGNIGQLYVDDRDNAPAWATVKTGLFGTKETFFPVGVAHAEGDEIMVDMPADEVKNAPSIEADQEISPNEEEELFSYYQERWGTGASAKEAAEDHARDDSQVQDDLHGSDMNNIDTKARRGDTPMGGITDTDSANSLDAASQEDRVASGQERKHVHLRKYTVTELVTEDGNVQHKEVVVERQPVDTPQAESNYNQDTKKYPLMGDERPLDDRGDSDY